jgi:ABC transporter with metal-binding/Fe-S-binding domain ATP-binding protein
MKVGVLFSGGKDSALALHKAEEAGHEIACLLNVDVENEDSFMFHKPYQGLIKEQAKQLGIELIQVKSRGEKEKELKDLEKLIMLGKEKGIRGVVVGGIASNYQGERIGKICDRMGLKMIAPLWAYDSEEIWKELLDLGFKVIMTKVSCDGLDSRWIGKVIDEGSLDELIKLGRKFKFRLDFEGGEAETAVLWMPGFSREIKINFNIDAEGQMRYWMRDVEVVN